MVNFWSVLSILIFIIGSILLINKLYSQQLRLNSFSFFISIFILFIIYFLLLFVSKPLSIPIQLIALSLTNCFLFKVKLNFAFRMTLSCFALSSMSELFVVFLLLFFRINTTSFDSFYSFIISIVTIFLSYGFISLNFVKQIFTSNELFINRIRFLVFLCFTLLAALSFVDLLLSNDTFFTIYELLIVCCVLFVFIIFLFFYFLGERLKYYSMKSTYDALLELNKTTEALMDAYRINVHENKNQLLIIKSLVYKNNKRLSTYLDSLLDLSDSNDNYPPFSSSVFQIPFSPLKAILFCKLNDAYQKKIDVSVDIAPNLVKRLPTSIEKQDLFDLTKICAIYLDNAIEAVVDILDKQISVSLYIGKVNGIDTLILSIANTFDSSINVEKIINSNESSKGIGHGYGLKIVKNIILHNKKIKTDHELISNVFIQNLYLPFENKKNGD